MIENNTPQNSDAFPTETQKTRGPKAGKVPIYIDGAMYHAQDDRLTGAQLRTFPSPPVGSDRDIWLDIVDELDQLIEDDQVVQLKPNMRFFTVPRIINPGQANNLTTDVRPMDATVLREQDRSFLDSLGSNSEIVVGEGFVSVVLSGYPTPGLDQHHADLLLRLPVGFPDATPDMFWVSPALTAHGAAIPGTEQIESYLGRSWQRWSRHIGGQWRVGVDNLETYLAYVRRAMALAGGN